MGTASLIIEQCRIGVNSAGGIQAGGHTGLITGNSIFLNGSSGSGGILLQRVQSAGNGFVIEQNEIDNNFAYNIWVQSADTFRIANNRFLSSETGWKDGHLHPAVHVRLGGTGLMVRDFVITQNSHRSQNSNTGASANHELTLYDIGDRSNIIRPHRTPLGPRIRQHLQRQEIPPPLRHQGRLHRCRLRKSANQAMSRKTRNPSSRQLLNGDVSITRHPQFLRPSNPDTPTTNPSVSSASSVVS